MHFYQLDAVEEKEIIPGYRAKFLHGEKMTIAYWDVDAAAILPEHSHPHEQIANVLSGSYELTIDGETRVMNPGDVAVIPGNVLHSGKALTACKLVDIFSPTREEYK